MKFCDNPKCRNHIECSKSAKDSRHILVHGEQVGIDTYTTRQVSLHPFVRADNRFTLICDDCKAAWDYIMETGRQTEVAG